MLNFFGDCHNVDEIKAMYRKLSKTHHPDLGGDEETMKLLNLAFEDVLRGRYSQFKTSAETETAVKYDVEVMNKLHEIVYLEGIEIEVCGTWIWLTGNTRVVKEDLKKAGFLWCSKKLAWSWHNREKEGKWRKSNLDLDEIRERHGSSKVPTEKRYAFA